MQVAMSASSAADDMCRILLEVKSNPAASTSRNTTSAYEIWTSGAIVAFE
ncbi:hypothetical protein DSM3645_22364 [Blastopirellula marina DSM 3645]|uniref:Uncharacterized protein n=1 Tax=Blastopirellula marina DSM 3645 TaxID=314230 RepID=A3ZUL6_9BACT|nr:hypothetical protein DSM3645_22364 [Blastopirellula marina DSM 3645]